MPRSFKSSANSPLGHRPAGPRRVPPTTQQGLTAATPRMRWVQQHQLEDPLQRCDATAGMELCDAARPQVWADHMTICFEPTSDQALSATPPLFPLRPITV